MTIEFADLSAQYQSIQAEIDAAIADVIAHSAFVGGSPVKTFENAFAAYVGARHCIGVGNGTDALYLALKALGIGAGDEVITSAFTFIAASEAITLAGAKVVFVDCDEKTYALDPAKTESAVTARTKAIIPVHLYGQCADPNAILEIAQKHYLHVVEDAAQAHGAKYLERYAGTFGSLACFSFFPGKNLGAYGDAGAVLTQDDALEKKIRLYANHGRVDKYQHEIEGMNSHLDGLQAAILRVKLKHLETWTEKRIAIAKRYDQAFHGLIETPYVFPGSRHVYHLYVVRVKNRATVQARLAEKGIANNIHYPIPLPFLKAYAYLGHQASDFPVANRLKDEVLSLPVHAEMTDAQVEYVIENVRLALRDQG